MPKKYFSSRRGTLAKRLDLAWADYNNQFLSKNARLKALDFMIYVFDITKFSTNKNGLNQLLKNLMDERESKKQNNPNYIPMLSNGIYQFESDRVLQATPISKVSAHADIQKAFDAGELLDVNQGSKQIDRSWGTTYLTPEQRAEYRIEIHNGLLHKKGRVFDSSELIAHNKPGFVAFTLNANGELSAFEHLGVQEDKQRRKLAHSSMNAGAPVLAAGEMEIKNGKLISINTYSGHYKPSLYSVARFLEYLSDRGVDISETKVYLRRAPGKASGLLSKKVHLAGDKHLWHEVPALDIVHQVKALMISNINSLDEYLNSTKTKLFRDVFKNDLTQAKSAIAQAFHDELVYAMDKMNGSSSMTDIEASLECLDSIVTRYSKENEQLNGTTGRLASKFADMKAQIQATRERLGIGDEEKERTRVESFKNTC
ncbi:hypothetical protein DGG96_09290 [Legionella qingyii]|uniref:Uncharacterized protein n=1 Tax=Legionella qingyii TaxID=2184757 RepID=A0A317U3T3_9GAMM|nr:hypothetical protein [Legionella qingyii]PWY55918.1 hypothetical protein DGG96_09290 [Legionella qingyii]RUR22496.1 hypothetical protein ELY20_09405 [Legionella qingyii]RUR27967.1 hypothetical protein ELY16_04140 [Legionella qingyii]